jgi:hypothetical protein
VSWAGTYPAAVAGILAAWGRAYPLQGAELRNGPQLTNPQAMEVLTAAFTSLEDDTAADGDWTPEGLGGTPDREQYTIACAASVLNGDGDVVAARARVFALVAAAGDAIAADYTLGGAVMSAAMGSWTVREDAADPGTVATVRFAVRIDAYTSR